MPTTPSFMDTVVRLLQPSCRLKSYRQSTRSTPGCHHIASRSTQGRTQFIWFGTRAGLAKRDMHQLSSQSPSLVELTTVKNLGFTLDQELTMKDYVSKLCQSTIVLLSAAPNSYNPALTISIRHSNFGACFHLFTH